MFGVLTMINLVLTKNLFEDLYNSLSNDKLRSTTCGLIEGMTFSKPAFYVDEFIKSKDKSILVSLYRYRLTLKLISTNDKPEIRTIYYDPGVLWTSANYDSDKADLMAKFVASYVKDFDIKDCDIFLNVFAEEKCESFSINTKVKENYFAVQFIDLLSVKRDLSVRITNNVLINCMRRGSTRIFRLKVPYKKILMCYPLICNNRFINEFINEDKEYLDFCGTTDDLFENLFVITGSENTFSNYFIHKICNNNDLESCNNNDLESCNNNDLESCNNNDLESCNNNDLESCNNNNVESCSENTSSSSIDKEVSSVSDNLFNAESFFNCILSKKVLFDYDFIGLNFHILTSLFNSSSFEISPDIFNLCRTVTDKFVLLNNLSSVEAFRGNLYSILKKFEKGMSNSDYNILDDEATELLRVIYTADKRLFIRQVQDILKSEVVKSNLHYHINVYLLNLYRRIKSKIGLYIHMYNHALSDKKDRNVADVLFIAHNKAKIRSYNEELFKTDYAFIRSRAKKVDNKFQRDKMRSFNSKMLDIFK